MGGEGQEFRRLRRKRQIFSNAIDVQNTSDLSPPKRKAPWADAVSWATLKQERSCIGRGLSQRRGKNRYYKEREKGGVKQTEVRQWEEADALG